MGNESQAEDKTKAERPIQTKRNFILKVMDSGGNEIKKALKQQGIEVLSIMEIHKEEIETN